MTPHSELRLMILCYSNRRNTTSASLPTQETHTLQIPSFILFLLASNSSQTSFSGGRGCPREPGNLSGDTPTGMPFSPSLSCSSGNTSSVFSRSKSPGMGVALAILKMRGEKRQNLKTPESKITLRLFYILLLDLTG